MKRVFLSLLVVLVSQLFGFSQGDSKLDIGKKVSKTINLKDKHSYTVFLEKGHFALVNLKQQGIDVKIVTYDPLGNKLEEFDSQNGSKGDELILLDALQEGAYRFEVIPLGEVKRERKGTYEIELVAINNAVESHLSQTIEHLNQRNYLPGFAITVVDKNKIRYKNAIGYANREHKVPYSMETVQGIASISKTFIGISLMLLVEEGKLTLDTPINEVLPFEVTNPYFSDIPITIRHLATHTSTINDFPIYYTKAGVLLEELPVAKEKYPKEIKMVIEMARKNEDMSMPAFIKKMLTKEGEWYKKKNFFKKPPGQDWFYSNVGAALAAYIVESISGIPYDEFVVSKILEPLDLKSAVWTDSEVAETKLAIYYTQSNIPLPKYKIITYPDGGLQINAMDLSKYLITLIKGYSGENGLLTADSFQEIMKVQHEQLEGDYKGRRDGIFWRYSTSGVMGHNGGDTGVIAMMNFHPESNLGYTLLCNMDPTENGNALTEFEKVWSTLKRYADFFKRN